MQSYPAEPLGLFDVIYGYYWVMLFSISWFERQARYKRYQAIADQTVFQPVTY